MPLSLSSVPPFCSWAHSLRLLYQLLYFSILKHAFCSFIFSIFLKLFNFSGGFLFFHLFLVCLQLVALSNSFMMTALKSLPNDPVSLLLVIGIYDWFHSFSLRSSWFFVWKGWTLDISLICWETESFTRAFLDSPLAKEGRHCHLLPPRGGRIPDSQLVFIDTQWGLCFLLLSARHRNLGCHVIFTDSHHVSTRWWWKSWLYLDIIWRPHVWG